MYIYFMFLFVYLHMYICMFFIGHLEVGVFTSYFSHLSLMKGFLVVSASCLTFLRGFAMFPVWVTFPLPRILLFLGACTYVPALAIWRFQRFCMLSFTMPSFSILPPDLYSSLFVLLGVLAVGYGMVTCQCNFPVLVCGFPLRFLICV